jgi:hypothetical protein
MMRHSNAPHDHASKKEASFRLSPALGAEIREVLQAVKASMKLVDQALYAKVDGAKTILADLRRRVEVLEQQQTAKSPKRKR